MTDRLPQQNLHTYTLSTDIYLENGKWKESYLRLDKPFPLSIAGFGFYYLSERQNFMVKRKKIPEVHVVILKVFFCKSETWGRNTSQVQPTTVLINYLRGKNKLT